MKEKSQRVITKSQQEFKLQIQCRCVHLQLAVKSTSRFVLSEPAQAWGVGPNDKWRKYFQPKFI